MNLFIRTKYSKLSYNKVEQSIVVTKKICSGKILGGVGQKKSKLNYS